MCHHITMHMFSSLWSRQADDNVSSVANLQVIINTLNGEEQVSAETPEAITNMPDNIERWPSGLGQMRGIGEGMALRDYLSMLEPEYGDTFG
jgi:hypothetical protein